MIPDNLQKNVTVEKIVDSKYPNTFAITLTHPKTEYFQMVYLVKDTIELVRLIEMCESRLVKKVKFINMVDVLSTKHMKSYKKYVKENSYFVSSPETTALYNVLELGIRSDDELVHDWENAVIRVLEL